MARCDPPSDPRAEFMRLYEKGLSLSKTARIYGLEPEEMGLALHYARLTKLLNNAAGNPQRAFVVAPPVMKPAGGKVFCAQCDHAVHPAEADRCSSPFCKAKAEAA